MQLSIIIVNWKSADFVRQCVASIRAYSRGIEYEIIVVDNASPDDSLTALRDIPGVQLIASPINLGFGGANNLGVANSHGQALLFLNPDTLLVSPAIEAMVQCLDSWPLTGAAGCRLLNDDGSLQTSCVQAYPTISNQVLDNEWIRARFSRARLWGPAAPEIPGHETPLPVEAVSGACLMVPRVIFEQIGGFSNRFFMYGEDIDLCYRIHKAGWKILHVPQATIIHYGGRSSGQRDDAAFGDVVMRESVYRLLLHTRGWVYAQGFRMAICLASLVRLAMLAAGRVSLLDKTKRSRLTSTFSRWLRILRWSLGLERWARALSGAGLNR